MKWQEIRLLMLTGDDKLVLTLGGKLQGWGATVVHCDVGKEPIFPEREADVALVDVRRQTSEVLRFLNSIKAKMPFVETVLVNSGDNIGASMAGMRNGASAELIVPFNTMTLRQTIDAACRRSRRRRAKKTRRSLLAVFGEAMSAATFAQAGEFSAAMEFLDASRTKQPDGRKDKETDAEIDSESTETKR